MNATRLTVSRILELGVGVTWREAGAVVYEALRLARGRQGAGSAHLAIDNVVRIHQSGYRCIRGLDSGANCLNAGYLGTWRRHFDVSFRGTREHGVLECGHRRREGAFDVVDRLTRGERQGECQSR